MIKSIAKWSVENRVTANILLVLILAAGAISVFRMKREMMPAFNLDMIYISVAYPSASPEEIEESICVKIEEAIKGIDGIRKITSTASENVGAILVELESNVSDNRRVLNDIETEVDRIETFPEEAKEPLIQEILFREPVVYVAVYGQASHLTLRKLAEKVRDDLTATKAVTQAELTGIRNYEISIELSEPVLRKYGLTFDEVATAVRRGSLDLPGGLIKTPDEEVAIRTEGQRYIGREFESIPVRSLPDGTRLTLGEIANIVDGFEDVNRYVRLNGKPAVLVAVSKTPDQDILEIADAVNEYVAQNRDSLPSGVQLKSFFDQSDLVESRLNLLIRNGIQGLILVFFILALFLHMRLAFWVALGIPLSFMGAFWVLGARGDTLNMISLFSFIMVLGMVVDDAIIIGENIFTKFRQGLPPVRACVEGTAQVGWPVIMTILTTVTAFMPLFFVSGIMGKFIAVMPMAVIATLLFSLFEALFILPAHLAHSLEGQVERAKREAKKKKLGLLVEKIEQNLETFIKKYYAPALKKVLRYRYLSFMVALSVLLLAIGLVIGGRVPFILFPKPDSDWLIAKVSFPYGTPIHITEKAIHHIEDAAVQLNSEYAGKIKGNQKTVNLIFTVMGRIMDERGEGGELGSHCGEVVVELLPSEKREIKYTKILSRWRELIGEIPGTEKLIYTTPVMGPGGNPIEVKLQGNNYDDLTLAAEELKNQIATYPGTFDIRDNFRPGKPELKVNLKPGASVLGIRLSDLARQLRQGFYGDEALRIQRGRDDVKVMVRYTQSERENRGTMEDMRVRTPTGKAIPFSQVAEIVEGRGFATIHRTDRQRTITVVSDVDEATANAKEITEELKSKFLPELGRRHPTVSISFGGQEEQTQESVGSLTRGFILALVVIYGLLATQFRSYIQAVIVMTAIPFGMIGAVVGHLTMGLPITLLSLFGIVALSGIVVNDSLVLIDFINQAVRNEGTPVLKAASEAGQARFRAVMLTTVTTFAGLLPILTETSFQAQFLIPMVVSISFGLLFATVLTLFLVPSLYLILDDITRFLADKRAF